MPYIAGGIPLLYGHIIFWLLNNNETPVEYIWLNAGSTVLLTVAAICIINLRWKTIIPNENSNTNQQLSSFILPAHALWLFTLHTACTRVFEPESFILMAVITSIIAAGLSITKPFYLLGYVSFLPMVFAFTGFIYSQTEIHRGFTLSREGELQLWIATIGAFGFACAYASFDILKKQITHLLKNDLYQWIHTILAMLLGFYTLSVAFQDEDFMLSLGIAGVIVALLSKWPGLKPALFLAVIYIMISHISFYALLDNGTLKQSMVFLWMSVIVGLITLIYPVISPRLIPTLKPETNSLMQWCFGISALFLFFLLFLSREGYLRNYITVFWGVSAILVFLVGLTDRMKPMRIIGLIGLCVCIARVFIVDIQEMFYRIAAFGVLSVVLLGVGFLYNKYRTRIE
jgi:hypothetical protein